MLKSTEISAAHAQVPTLPRLHDFLTSCHSTVDGSSSYPGKCHWPFLPPTDPTSFWGRENHTKEHDQTVKKKKYKWAIRSKQTQNYKQISKKKGNAFCFNKIWGTLFKNLKADAFLINPYHMENFIYRKRDSGCINFQIRHLMEKLFLFWTMFLYLFSVFQNRLTWQWLQFQFLDPWNIPELLLLLLKSYSWGKVGGYYIIAISGIQRGSEQHVPLSKATYSSCTRHLTGVSLRKSKQ